MKSVPCIRTWGYAAAGGDNPLFVCCFQNTFQQQRFQSQKQSGDITALRNPSTASLQDQESTSPYKYFRCTNILAYSTMHKYLPIKWQNWQKDMEKLYNKMRNGAPHS